MTSSPNHDARPARVPIDMIVLHYTGMRTGAAAIARLCDPAAKVSSHHVVEEDGSILTLVDESRRAWHAGQSFWRGHTGLNDRSIGIEIVNPGHEWGYRAFPDAQIAGVIALSRAVLGRHPIPPRNVVAHSDVAAERKQDPGELFPWARLAAAGVGLWPAPGGVACQAIEPALGAIGYRTGPGAPTLAVTLAAFQRHWAPHRTDGVVDETTALALGGIAALVA